jgi:hypothetical protein
MAELVCRKCGRELHNTFDLCPACRAEQERLDEDRKRQTAALEAIAREEEDRRRKRVRRDNERHAAEVRRAGACATCEGGRSCPVCGGSGKVIGSPKTVGGKVKGVLAALLWHTTGIDRTLDAAGDDPCTFCGASGRCPTCGENAAKPMPSTTAEVVSAPGSSSPQPLAPVPESDLQPDEREEVEPWEVARRWASRNQHVVFWLSVGLTFPLGLIAMLGVAASGEPLAAVVALPFAFLPLVLMGFAVERTKKLVEFRRLVVGKWQVKRPEGEWRLQFTDDGTLILNDAMVARYVLYGNLELAASDQVRAVLGERIVSLSEGELVVMVNGSMCRFTRTA